ncbi:hypothetical protein N7454_003654 [Penicillium verhagenii]|nr:hypothetical protein N7454_003654 [Penicillium verhagenii]
MSTSIDKNFIKVAASVVEVTGDTPQAPPQPPLDVSANIQVKAEELIPSFSKNLKIEETPTVVFVDTPTGIEELVQALDNLPVDPPSLYLDLEGIHLCRDGTISLMQIFILPLGQTYVVDIHTLKKRAFSTPGPPGSRLTLRSVLESYSIPKVFHDVRNDSDALFAHYQIRLGGVQDLQLMELAARKGGQRRLVNGLGRCIEHDAPMKDRERREWKSTKNAGLKLFAPEHGGSYAVFDKRPLADEIMNYCVQDVCFLPLLWEKYRDAMTPQWFERVKNESQSRVAHSQSASYVPSGRHKALGPKGWLHIV